MRTPAHPAQSDVESQSPMRRDALFRTASLTKPVTSVAALMLYDAGRFDLADPITDWAPEFRARWPTPRRPQHRPE